MIAYDPEALTEFGATWRAVRKESALLKRTSNRLFPRLLALVGQQGKSLIDRLNQVERLGLLEDAQAWLAWRNLRNRLVHEYVETPEDFVDSLRIARDYSAALGEVVALINEWLRNLGIDETVLS